MTGPMPLKAGTAVRSVDNPGRQGVITDAAPQQRASGTYWQVTWADGPADLCHEHEIEPLDPLEPLDASALARQGRYGRAADLRRHLTRVHLSGRLANLIYAMGITSTDFHPHQYRPLLTLLDSPASGLLIADEVGLGKTIEAGLIWTELRARHDARRLLVVCPAILREKWHAELASRFGVDAQLVDAAQLLTALAQPRAQLGGGRAWIASYPALRPPRETASSAHTAPKKASARTELADFLRAHAGEEPLLDLVVLDEAHILRNRGSTAWQLGELLREVSARQLMLSATPIHGKNRDLFNLLALLDPDHFASEEDFERLLAANRLLDEALDTLLSTKSTAAEIRRRLGAAAGDPLLAGSEPLQGFLKAPPSDEVLTTPAHRAALTEALEHANLFSHVVTRTLKRELPGQRIQRHVRLQAVDMSEPERALYAAVIGRTRQFAQARGISDGFLLATPQRQVTSSPAATALAWAPGGEGADGLIEDTADELADESGDEASPASLREALEQTLPGKIDPAELRRKDSKLKALIDLLAVHLQEHPLEKIVVLTSFRATARHLAGRLSQHGFPAILLSGGKDSPRQGVIDQFQHSATHPVLVATDVAAEGVDLQFCRVLVSYDLPWSPARIEQRAGRIDRLGQQSPEIHLWTLYFRGTLDEGIVSRLLAPLAVFEEALSEPGAVVGETLRRLQSELLSQPLTPEEEAATIDRAAQALGPLHRPREEIGETPPQRMAAGTRMRARIAAAHALAQRVTGEDLYLHVKDYLGRHWPGHRFIQEGTDRLVVSLQLPGELAMSLEDFLTAQGLQGRTRLAAGQVQTCRFLNRISHPQRRAEEIIHQFHPLVRFIGHDLKARNERFYPLVAVQLESRGLPPGVYVFRAESFVFQGLREEEVLAVAALALSTGEALSAEAADLLLQETRTLGRDWIEGGELLPPRQVVARMEASEALLGARYQALLTHRHAANADRARIQLELLEHPLRGRLPRLQGLAAAHQAAGRTSLAKATLGQVDKLLVRMDSRRAHIRRRQEIRAGRDFVCAGVIRVEDRKKS